MRWLFPIALSPAESTARDAKLADIDAWWAELAAAWPNIQASFRREGDFDVAAFVQRAFNGRVHPDLMWEFGPHAAGGDFLALCPESRRELTPLVDAALARAPAIDGLTLRRGRPPVGVKSADGMVRARAGGGLPARVHAALHDGGPLVAVTWELAPGEAVNDAARNRAFVATEAMLGEAVLDTWIGPIDVTGPPKAGWFARLLGKAPPPSAEPVETLAERVAALVADVQRALPAAPYGRELADADGALLQITRNGPPSSARRGDLFVAQSRVPTLAAALFSDALFASERHSAHGELFAYVKIAHDPADAGQEVAARSRYEDALFAALTAAGLGVPVGAGMGAGYAYIDLALTRPDDALAVIRATLQALGAPEQAWILFFDATLGDEWVGVWDHTPAPPADDDSAS